MTIPEPTDTDPRPVSGYLIATCKVGAPHPDGVQIGFGARRSWCYATDPYRPHDHYQNGQPLRGRVRYATCAHGPTCLLHDNCQPFDPTPSNSSD